MNWLTRRTAGRSRISEFIASQNVPRILISSCSTRTSLGSSSANQHGRTASPASAFTASNWQRSEEHTSELQSLMRISYAVFCLKKKQNSCTYTSTCNTNSTNHTINRPNNYTNHTCQLTTT